MGREGFKFSTRRGKRGVVLKDKGNALFVKFFSGETGFISPEDIQPTKKTQPKFYKPETVSEKPCPNCGNQELHKIASGNRCSLCDNEYLENFKSWLYTEMAMQTGSNIALVQYGTTIILFNPSLKFKKAVFSQSWDKMKQSDSLIGVADIRENKLYKSMEVDQIWAKQGYGPLLYLTVMSLYPKGLMPTRTPDITDAAKGVWKNFHQGVGQKFVTSNDVNASHHKDDYLNLNYKIKEIYPLLPEMKRRGKAFFAGDNYQEVFDSFIEFSIAHLQGKMREIY